MAPRSAGQSEVQQRVLELASRAEAKLAPSLLVCGLVLAFEIAMGIRSGSLLATLGCGLFAGIVALSVVWAQLAYVRRAREAALSEGVARTFLAWHRDEHRRRGKTLLWVAPIFVAVTWAACLLARIIPDDALALFGLVVTTTLLAHAWFRAKRASSCE